MAPTPIDSPGRVHAPGRRGAHRTGVVRRRGGPRLDAGENSPRGPGATRSREPPRTPPARRHERRGPVPGRRGGRELLRPDEVRGRGERDVRPEGRGEGGGLRVPRGVLRPRPLALVAGARLPGRVRTGVPPETPLTSCPLFAGKIRFRSGAARPLTPDTQPGPASRQESAGFSYGSPIASLSQARA